MRTLPILTFLILFGWSSGSQAWFFIFPIPNLAKPTGLQNIIDALEKSTQTRALAYVSEDKTFGGKYWVWGQYAGYVSQEDANSQALTQCENNLARVKAQTAGGQPVYDFGTKRCELHEFTANNAPVPPPVQPVSAPVPPPVQPVSDPVSPAPSVSAPVAPAEPTATSTTSGDAEGVSPTAKKLRELKSLFEQRLITQEEYDEKRKAILQGL